MIHLVEHSGVFAVRFLEELFEARKFPAPNRRFVPRQAVLAYGVNDGKPDQLVGGGFLFLSDANAAIIGHLVTNPKAPGPVRHEALDSIIECLWRKATSQGFEMVCCSTDNEKLMERFTRLGFAKTDEGVSNFGRIVCR
jgi:hypothetical protein